MSAKRDALSDLKTAFNCPAKWSAMRGDERVRHCTQCSQNVYNISQMSREEAVQLLEENGEKVCVRFYQKADGTILTRPCKGIKRVTHGWKMAGLTALAVIGYPACSPIAFAGQAKLSPRAMFKMSLKRVQMYNKDIAATEDMDQRETLIEMRDQERKRLKATFDRLEPEDIEEMGPLISGSG